MLKNLREEIEKELEITLDYSCKPGKERDYAIESFLSFFRQAIDETIGEDEEKAAQPLPRYVKERIRNQLRAEQRERANQIISKE